MAVRQNLYKETLVRAIPCKTNCGVKRKPLPPGMNLCCGDCVGCLFAQPFARPTKIFKIKIFVVQQFKL